MANHANDLDDTAAVPSKPAAALLSCPDELMVEIFSYGCAGPDDIGHSYEIMRLNEPRCRASFITAAVCQRWRSISLSHPTLWHYIGIPALGKLGDEAVSRLLDYTQLVLARSQQVPIDVVFNFISGDRHEHILLESFFEPLVQHVSRWRRFAAVVSGIDATHRVLRLLSSDTPQLWTVQLAYQESSDQHSRDVYPRSFSEPIRIPASFLPHAPLMKNLCVYNLPEVWEHWNSRPQKSLLVFEIGQLTPPPSIWDLLAQHSELTWLVLSCRIVEESTLCVPPPQPIKMPNLRTVWLTRDAYKIFAMYPNALQLRSVKLVTLEGPELATLRPWFRSMRESLTTLDLRHILSFSTADVETIQDLPHLDWLQISGGGQIPQAMLDPLLAEEFVPPSQSSSNTSSEASIEAKPSNQERTRRGVVAMWPRLATFYIFCAWFDDLGAATFLQLVKKRSIEGPRNAANVPKWRNMQVILYQAMGFSAEQLEEMENMGVQTLTDGS